jgi:hypothetical protein
MELNAFRQTLSEASPPSSLSPCLIALWHDARGDWESAHDIINDMPGEKAAWVHAYLHRKEGDPGNARYWYSRAGKSFPSLSMDEEWEEIVIALL